MSLPVYSVNVLAGPVSFPDLTLKVKVCRPCVRGPNGTSTVWPALAVMAVASVSSALAASSSEVPSGISVPSANSVGRVILTVPLREGVPVNVFDTMVALPGVPVTAFSATAKKENLSFPENVHTRAISRAEELKV